MNPLRLPLPPFPYRFDLLLDFARRIPYPARMAVDGDQLWRYTCGQLLCYQQVDGAIVISGAGIAPGNRARIQKESIHLLGLARDCSDFFAFAREDAPLWAVVAPLHGFPIACTETVFEALITLIIEQHISWKAANRAQRILLTQFSPGVPIANQRVADFPTPRQLASAQPEQLKALKITDRRCALIIDIARQVTAGALDLPGIAHLGLDEAYRRLLRIKGVGAWTAGNVLGRALGHFPRVSQKDVALKAAVNRYFYGDAGAKSAERVSETFGSYGRFAGMASHLVLLRWVLERYPPLSSPLPPPADLA